MENQFTEKEIIIPAKGDLVKFSGLCIKVKYPNNEFSSPWKQEEDVFGLYMKDLILAVGTARMLWSLFLVGEEYWCQYKLTISW